MITKTLPQSPHLFPAKLVVLDHHQREGDQPCHGEDVALVARSQGFQGNLYPLDASWRPLVQSSRMREVAGQLWRAADSPAQLRESLVAEALASRVGLLNSVSDDLELFNQRGVENTVVNLSQGSCPASAFRHIFDSKFEEEPGSRYRQAFGLEGESEGETHAILKDLLELVAATSQDLEFQAARNRYTDALETFLERRNSVVVAAGNEGRMVDNCLSLTGRRLEVPASYFANDLAHPRVMVVGATESYSSEYPGVKVYAEGRTVDKQGEGTSFAAPRVAVVLAQLHADYPEESSQAIEERFKENFLRQTDRPDLSADAAEYFFSDRYRRSDGSPLSRLT